MQGKWCFRMWEQQALQTSSPHSSVFCNDVQWWYFVFPSGENISLGQTETVSTSAGPWLQGLRLVECKVDDLIAYLYKALFSLDVVLARAAQYVHNELNFPFRRQQMNGAVATCFGDRSTFIIVCTFLGLGCLEPHVCPKSLFSRKSWIGQRIKKK